MIFTVFLHHLQVKQLQHYNVKPIQLDLAPSYLLMALLGFVALAACVIVLCMPIWLSLQLLVCVLIVFAAVYAVLQDALLLLPWSLLMFAVNTKGQCTITQKNGLKFAVQVQDSSFVAAYCTVLNLKLEARYWQRSLLITTDRVDINVFRQLRVWIGWGNVSQEASDPIRSF